MWLISGSVRGPWRAFRASVRSPSCWYVVRCTRGHRFRLHRANLPSGPDLKLVRYRAAIIVSGCFWHRHRGCNRMTTPVSRAEFWQEKFLRNQERDGWMRGALLADGWRVALIWECALRIDPAAVSEAVSGWLRSGETEFEFPLKQ